MIEYIIYISFIGVSIGALLFVLAAKWIILGLKIVWAKFRYKDFAGLAVPLNKVGDIGVPKVCDLRNDTFDDHPIPKDLNKRFLGMPYFFYGSNDISTQAGIYYPHTTKDGEPLYYKDENDNIILDNKGDPIPKIGAIKQGAVFSKSLLKAIVLDLALTSAIKDLFAKNKQIFLFVAIAMGASVIAAYFAYDFNSNYLPEIMSLLRTAASCGVAG